MTAWLFGWLRSPVKARLLECEISRSVLFSCRGSHKQRRTFKFAFGLEPVLKLSTWEAAALKIDFVSAAPDLVVIQCVVCRTGFCARLNRACVKLQSLVSLALQCHTRVPSFRT